jgi:hypothetical protein
MTPRCQTGKIQPQQLGCCTPVSRPCQISRLHRGKKIIVLRLGSRIFSRLTVYGKFDYLDTLTTFGFLSREVLLEKAKYSNSINTDFFLDRKKTSYIGGILELMNNIRLYGFWGNLEAGLLTGHTQNEAKHGDNVFEKIYASADALKEFIHAMSGVQMGAYTGNHIAKKSSNIKTWSSQYFHSGFRTYFLSFPVKSVT